MDRSCCRYFDVRIGRFGFVGRFGKKVDVADTTSVGQIVLSLRDAVLPTQVLQGF